jgi:hypothetical protein
MAFIAGTLFAAPWLLWLRYQHGYLHSQKPGPLFFRVPGAKPGQDTE